jgi:Domain of unknown function (DUF4845)
MKRSMRQPQLGMTFVGILCILALVGVIAYAGIRLIPVYLNYMKIARTMDVTATEFKGENPDVGALRRSLEHHWIVEDPSAVEVKEIEITKNDSGVLMHVAYDDAVPYIANVSLSVHFDKTVKVQ